MGNYGAAENIKKQWSKDVSMEIHENSTLEAWKM
jgi:hypothetical protein